MATFNVWHRTNHNIIMFFFIFALLYLIFLLTDKRFSILNLRYLLQGKTGNTYNTHKQTWLKLIKSTQSDFKSEQAIRQYTHCENHSWLHNLSKPAANKYTEISIKLLRLRLKRLLNSTVKACNLCLDFRIQHSRHVNH